MKTALFVTISAVATLALASCATIVTEATRTEPQARPARPADYPIDVLEQNVPVRRHKVIGSVRARVKLSESGHDVAPPPKVVAVLKKQARELGGDALLPITVTPSAGGGNYLAPTARVLAGSSEIWSALVIVWLEP